LLHGFTGSPRSWAAIRARLAAEPGLVAIAPALSGHAGTACEVASFEQEVDRLAALLKPHAPVRLCGYSLGARLGLGLLLRHSDLVHGAVLIGVNPGLESEPERAARLVSDERWAMLLERGDTETFADAWEAQPLFASQAGVAPDALAEQRRIRIGHDPSVLAQALRVLGLARMPNYWPQLASVTTPLELLAGERDLKFAALLARIGTEVRHARQRLVARAGHNLLLERPDAVCDVLRSMPS
jgi:2-succinyl-6-hydroxy-2,4-cyclohexadiene-1-carboxylate synthase